VARLASRLTYANVVASLALFVALGGGAYAAVALPKNSVGSRQIKNAAVTHADLAKNAVTGANVKDGSLLSADFKTGQLPAAPPGPKGDSGAPGLLGAAGQPGAPGSPAAYPTVLPSGRTEVGVYAVRDKAVATGTAIAAAISFLIPLSTAPSVVFAADPSCAGSVSAPTAAPGVLCIYEGQTVNAALFVTDDQGNIGSAAPQGAGLQAVATASGDTIAQGAWAVTAP
jgi:hypothetical protein